MSFDFGLPSAATLADIGYSMGAQMVARHDAARRRADLSAALDHSNAVAQDLWSKNEHLRKRNSCLVDDYNSLVEKYNAIRGPANEALETARNTQKHLDSTIEKYNAIIDPFKEAVALASDHKKLLDKAIREVKVVQAQRDNARSQNAKLKTQVMFYATKAREIGAKAFAYKRLYTELRTEIRQKDHWKEYESLSPQYRDQIATWAYVTFANANVLDFRCLGTIFNLPPCVEAYNWSKRSSAAKSWPTYVSHALRKLPAEECDVQIAISSPDAFAKNCAELASSYQLWR